MPDEPVIPPTAEDLAAPFYPDVVFNMNDHGIDPKNPDGVTNATDDYAPRSIPEKAEYVFASFAEPVDVAPEAPYPTGNPPDEAARVAMLERVHSPQELVQGSDAAAQQEANLRAGGSVEGGLRAEGVDDNLTEGA